MAVKLSPWFVSRETSGLSCNCSFSNGNIPLPYSHRLFPASCKMRQRNLSSPNKRQHLKKATHEPLTNGSFEPDPEIPSMPSRPISNQESMSNKDVPNSTDMEHDDAKDLSGLVLSGETKSLVKSVDSAEKLSGIQLEDLIRMIRNAEKRNANFHILLLNKSQVRALNDLEKILSEKEALQGEINTLQMRLAETDAPIKVAAQEKIDVELLESQLEKLQNELTHRGSTENQNSQLKEEVSPTREKCHFSSMELDSLRSENFSLKNNIKMLKEELSHVKNTDERVVMLEKESASLESALKNVESNCQLPRKMFQSFPL